MPTSRNATTDVHIADGTDARHILDRCRAIPMTTYITCQRMTITIEVTTEAC